MDNLIRIYDNVIPFDVCDSLIEKFEQNQSQHEVQHSSAYDFTQIDFALNFKEWGPEMQLLLNLLFPCVEKYKKEISPIWPTKYGFESPRMKKYLPNGTDEFRTHVDINDDKNSVRFLVFFVYLCDNEGGQTIINPIGGEEVNSPCKKGSVLMFPPMWTHPHSGKKPIDKPKYIVGSYLHYVGQNLKTGV
tara:strand:+ start:209 stop:778 length:570 start_codon:yes stop_codon:yes gene_type:complete